MMTASLKRTHTLQLLFRQSQNRMRVTSAALFPHVLSVCLLTLVNPLPLLQLACCIAFPSGLMLYVFKCTEIQKLLFLQFSLHLTLP